MHKLSDDDLIALVMFNLDNTDTDNQLLREDIQLSDDYYFGRLPGAAATGRSSATALECQTMVVAVSAEMIQGFVSDIPAAFEPIADGDDSQAEVESYAVSQTLEDAGGYMIVSAAIDSALRYKNCATLVSVVDIVEHESDVVRDITRQQAALLISQAPKSIDVELTAFIDATDDKPSRAEFSITVNTQKVSIDPIDISLLKYRKDWHKPDISDIPFVAVEHIDQRRADLLALFPTKAKIIADLPAIEGGRIYDDATRSKLVGEERSHQGADVRDNDLVAWDEVWIQVAIGNGATERRHIAISNRELLLDEAWQGGPPIATGIVFPQPHRFQGVSLVTKLQDIQERASYGMRQLEDNLATGNVPSTSGYDVEIEDVTSARASKHVRLNSPNSQYQVHPPLDNVSNSLAYLDQLKGQRNERGGSALSMQDPMVESLKNQAGAVANQQAMGHQESISAYISTNFGETYVRSLWLTIHEQLRLRFAGTMQLRQADTFVEISPSDWRRRFRLTLKAGMSASARNRKASNLAQMINMQLQFLQAGVPIADVNGLHAAVRDWGLASDLDSVNTYLIDPQSEKGQQLAQQAAEQQQQLQQQQLQAVEREQVREDAKVQIDGQKVGNDAQKEAGMLRWRYYDTNIDAEVALMGKVADAETQRQTTAAASIERPATNGSDRGGTP